MSSQDKLDQTKKPRVHIKYEVETENGNEEKELPFVVGVIGDFSGNNSPIEKINIKNRNFKTIDANNFDSIMNEISPGLSLQVENTLEGNNNDMLLELQFSSLEDFEPHKIVDQVDSLKKLMNSRNLLRDLLTKVDRSEDLEILLEETIKDNRILQKLSSEIDADRIEAPKRS